MLRPARNPKKPYTAITAIIERNTREDVELDDITAIPILIDTINQLKLNGIKEASRAIRMELLYGSDHHRLRALTILDVLIQNAGETFQKNFADTKLADGLDKCLKCSNPAVREKCAGLMRGWLKYDAHIARTYKSSLGINIVTSASRNHGQAPAVRQADNPFGDGEEEERPAPSHAPKPFLTPVQANGGSTQSRGSFFKKKDKKNKVKGKNFNFEAEKPLMKACIADSSIAATNLEDVLRSAPHGGERISRDPTAIRYFEECKNQRQKIKIYLHHLTEREYVGAEQYVGPLLEANTKLMDTLRTFKYSDSSVDAESDSDDELALQQHAYKMLEEKNKREQASNGSLGHQITTPITQQSKNPEKAPPMPPRRAPVVVPSMLEPEEVDNDPFGDGNALQTPGMEKDEPRWAVV